MINPIKDILFVEKAIKVKKDHHYPGFFHLGIFPKLYFKNKTSISRDFKMTEDSMFIFPGEDQFDWSKLLGLSFGHHQKNNSFRFGFRFLDANKFQVCKYMYLNGKRTIEEINNELLINQWYRFKILYIKQTNTIAYSIFEIKPDGMLELLHDSIVKKSKLKIWGYSLGLYLGGNLTIPKTLWFVKKK